LAAVGGRQIDKQVLSHASAQADLSGWLMMCANASVLEVQGGTWLFAHDKVREVLLTHLDNGQRQQMHRQLAESITTVHLNDSSYDSALGHHWIQANVPEKSYKYFLKAGQAAARLYALKVARAHFSSALAALDRLPGSEERSREKFDILLQKISASQQSDRLDAYLAQTSAAETILNSLPLQGPNFQADQVRRSRLLFLKARGYFLNSDPSNSLACYRAAFNLASEHNDKMQMAALSGAIGCTLLLQGYVVKAQPFLREAINFFKGQKLILEAARLLGFLGVATVANGQVRKGREFIREAAASLSSDPAFSVSIFGFSGMNYFLLEDWKLLRDSAVSSLDNTLYTDELFVCSQFWWMAWAEACLGMHDKSTMHRRKAEEIFSKRQTVLTHDWLLVGDADMALRAGNAELAIERVEKAIEVAKNMDGVLALGLAHRVWARALAAKNRPDWDSAERHLSESIRFLESGALWLPVAHTRMTWGQLSAMRGDIANAIVQYKLAEALFARSEESSLVIKAQERLATLSTPSS